MSDFDSERHYYGIEVVDNSGPEPTTMSVYEAEDARELGEKVAALATLGNVEYPRTIEVSRMTRLDAPLTDEEEAEMEEWIESLGDASAGDELDEPEPEHCDLSEVGAQRYCQHCSTWVGVANWPTHTHISEGDHYIDPHSVPKYGDGVVEVVEVANELAEDYVIEYTGGGSSQGPRTVADVNPDYDPLEPVVVGTYAEGSAKHYAFPVSRLLDGGEV